MEKNQLIDAQITSKSRDSKSSGVTQNQISKFQELQRRRLQLMSKPKNKKFKTKGAKSKSRNENLETKESLDENLDQCVKDAGNATSSSQGCETNDLSSSSPRSDVHPVFQKKKLHWGLDSKERWERKANM
ncbi:hypothetical protein vseg_006561 [Gypsophila vaccaria]